jgi:hypothetical protein
MQLQVFAACFFACRLVECIGLMIFNVTEILGITNLLVHTYLGWYFAVFEEEIRRIHIRIISKIEYLGIKAMRVEILCLQTNSSETEEK